MLWNTVGVLLLCAGLFLDWLNVRWGYTSAKGEQFKSGVLIVPAILYIVGVLVLMRGFTLSHRLGICVFSVVLHGLCSQILLWVFDKLFYKPEPLEKGDSATDQSD